MLGKSDYVLWEQIIGEYIKGHTSNYLMFHTNEKLQKGEIYNLIV